ncbi:MAG TPA: ATP-grasp domain-containing protein [Thermoanaerobaculia bacterium]|nr:ATP-grasp domain-containing protein [Thermoanaerobaculia bacterium]
MKRRLLLVHDDTAAVSTAIRSIVRKDVDLYLVSGMDGAVELPPDRRMVVDTSDRSALASAVREFGVGFQAIGTFTESCVIRTAELASDLGLPGPSVEAMARTSADKFAMRTALAAGGLSRPRFRILDQLSEKTLGAAVDELGTVVLKPAAGESSIGVRKVLPGDDLGGVVMPAVRAAVAAARHAMVHIDATRWVAEEYVPGPMVSVDGFVVDHAPTIVGIVENELSAEPYFTPQANWLPTRLSRDRENACRTVALEALRVLGLDRCAFHCELRFGPDGPVLIEVAGRLPGGQLPAAYERSLGIDLIAAQVDLWIGDKPDLMPQSRIQIYQKGVFPKRAGIIRSVSGFEEACVMPGVWQFIGIARAGEPVVTHPAIPVPYFYYAVEALHADEVMHLAERLESLVEVQLA